MSFESPRTPERPTNNYPPLTVRRANYFYDVDNRRDGETLDAIALRHGIGRNTGINWRRERKEFGTPVAVHRMRKIKAVEKGQKLGRPFSIPQKTLDDMCTPAKNPERWKPLVLQRRYWEISVKLRSLQHSLKTRKKKAGMYVASRRKLLQKDNKIKRVSYGYEHRKWRISKGWDRVYFTDEAHYNVTGHYQDPRVLREQGTREDPENIAQEHELEKNWALHMYSYVNYYEKGPLNFYSEEDDDNNPLPTPKPPGKPRKKKGETDSQLLQRIINWEASKPPEVETEILGAHMTQKYYTQHVLSMYISALQSARMRDDLGDFILQEDNDSSHGTKTTYNVAYKSRRSNWIHTINHPAQSPDLNAIEGCWNILFQRTEQRILHGKERLPQELQSTEVNWDGSKNDLKRILREEWDKITLQEVRARIDEMLKRCEEMIRTGGLPYKSKLW